jgi:hypothetical protein
METELRLGRDVLQELVRLFQLGLLTGTDIVDNFLAVRVTLSDTNDELHLTRSYQKTSAESLDELVRNVNDLKTSLNDTNVRQ